MVMQTTKEKSVCAVKQNKENTNDISEKAISTHTLIKLIKLFLFAKQFRKQWGFYKTDWSNALKDQRDFIITAFGAFLCLQSTELKKRLDRATYCLHAPKFEVKLF